MRSTVVSMTFSGLEVAMDEWRQTLDGDAALRNQPSQRPLTTSSIVSR
jgi:hypothetical protein